MLAVKRRPQAQPLHRKEAAAPQRVQQQPQQANQAPAWTSALNHRPHAALHARQPVAAATSSAHRHGEPGVDEGRMREPIATRSETPDEEDQTARSEAHPSPRHEFSVGGAIVGGLAGAAIGGLAGLATAGPVGAVVGAVAGGAIGAAVGGHKNAVTFPTWGEVVSNGDVQTKINAAWASTKASATPGGRREEGFWIRKNMGTGKFEFTPTITGRVVGPADGAAVDIGPRPADTNPGQPDAVYSVASFHTHTPTTHRTVGRPVGPSGADHSVDTSDDVTGVVYDYTESPAGSGNIPAAHPLHSAAQVYHSGPARRQRL